MQPQQPIIEPPQSPPDTPPQTVVTLSPELPEVPPEPEKSEGISSIISTVGILIAAPIVAFLLTAFVFQSYEVDGPSMEATLSDNDRLLVLKFPRTIAKITGNDYIPKRADVIIFNSSSLSDGEGGKKQLIKRVIGVPGDRVVIQNGVVMVYNKDNPNGFNPDKTYDYGSVITATSNETDVMVGEGEVFVLGDNRSNSLDSRVLGNVAAEDIVGKLLLRIYPIGNAERF